MLRKGFREAATLLLLTPLALVGCSTATPAAVGSPGASSAAATATAAADCTLLSAPEPGNSEPPAGVAMAEKAPKLTAKDNFVAAFSQNASNNPWRLAETASMKAEAEKQGVKLTITDGNNDQAKQIQDVRSLISQKPDILFLAPMTDPVATVVKEAAKAGIPVVLLDREVDKSAVAGTDYVTVIRSDFVQEGKRAAWAMAKATNGKATIIELEGTTGASPANDRKKGFDEAIAACPDMKVVASQDGDFTRAKGQQVAEALLQAHPDATAVYAHNDEMALGAISAIKSMGKTPGKDIMVVSIDGEKDALQAIIDGELYASVECNPGFGPSAFEVMKKYAAGEKIPTVMINPDKMYDASNAKDFLATAY